MTCSVFSRRRVLPIGDVQISVSILSDVYLIVIIIIRIVIYYLSTASSVNDEEYCQWETFRPRCLPGDTVVVSKAVYGRMSATGRCLQDEEKLPMLRDDPKYMGCFEDVLPVVSARCSGRSDCEIRIPDPEMERTNPCYRHMAKYLEVMYRCIRGRTR